MFMITDGTVSVVLHGPRHGFIILMAGADTDTADTTTHGDTDTVLGAGVADMVTDSVGFTAALAGADTEHGALLTVIIMGLIIIPTETAAMHTIVVEEVTKPIQMLFQEEILDMYQEVLT